MTHDGARPVRPGPVGTQYRTTERVSADEPAEILVWEMHAGLAA